MGTNENGRNGAALHEEHDGPCDDCIRQQLERMLDFRFWLMREVFIEELEHADLPASQRRKVLGTVRATLRALVKEYGREDLDFFELDYLDGRVDALGWVLGTEEMCYYEGGRVVREQGLGRYLLACSECGAQVVGTPIAAALNHLEHMCIETNDASLPKLAAVEAGA